MTRHQGSHVSRFSKGGNLPEAGILPVCSIARLRGVSSPAASKEAVQSALLFLRFNRRTARKPPATTSNAKQKPGHHWGTPGSSMTR
jgi:hypothetical protein